MPEAATASPRAAGPGPPAAARASSPRSRFDDALARARTRLARTPGGAGRGLAPETASGSRGACGGEARHCGPAPAGRSVPDAAAEAMPGGAAAPALLAAAPGLASPTELQEVVRALPPTIAAFAGRGGGELTLAFGGALGVDLRSGAQGLEVALRPAPSLERVARAELPGLVEALRARGLRVARAEVRPRPQGRGGHRAR